LSPWLFQHHNRQSFQIFNLCNTITIFIGIMVVDFILG
jgi:hypothetical protein